MKVKLLNRLFSLRELWKLRFGLFILMCRLIQPATFTNLANLLFCMYSKKAIVKGLPFFLMIESTSRCNLQCPMCMLQIFGLNNRPTQDMPFTRFQEIIDKMEVPPLILAFWNYGEPLLNPDLFKMINYVSKKNIFTVVYTNGALLNEDKIKDTLDSGLNYLSISIDGATSVTYNIYRQGGDFKQLLKNINNLIIERRIRKNKRLFIELQFIVMRHNEHELDKMRSLSRELGVDKLVFRKFMYLPTSRFFSPRDFLPQQEEFVRSRYGGSVHSSKNCLRPWMETVINSNGSVVPCCYDFFSQRSMGNAFLEPLGMLWNNTSYINFRESLSKGAKDLELCNIWCSEVGYDHNKFRYE